MQNDPASQLTLAMFLTTNSGSMSTFKTLRE